MPDDDSIWSENHRVSLSLTRSINNGTSEPEAFTLVVTEIKSGMRLLEIPLSPDDFADMMSARTVGDVTGIPARLLREELRSTIGKQEFIVTRHYAPPPVDHDAQLEVALKWAQLTAPWVIATRAGVARDGAKVRVRWVAHFTDVADGEHWRELYTTSDTLTPPWEK